MSKGCAKVSLLRKRRFYEVPRTSDHRKDNKINALLFKNRQKCIKGVIGYGCERGYSQLLPYWSKMIW